MLGDRAAEAADQPQPQQVLAGKYRIERELGKGGMGIVYAATHLVTERRVALKWMLAGKDGATATERFVREARAAGRIDHPNVVQVLDVGEDKVGPFIVMEFLNGEPLSALLSRIRLSPTEAIDLLMPAMRGVHAAHAEGVVHRDLKPENIFLCRDRDGAPLEAKVLDFGISKLTWDVEPIDTLTRPGALVGTPHYMAPERVRGHLDDDPRTDVYSFGVMLYEVLTGALPFDSPHLGELIARITGGNPRPPRDIDANIPAELEAVVLKAMSRRIEERHEDIQSLAVALEPFASEQRFKVMRRDPTGRIRTDPRPSNAPTMLLPADVVRDQSDETVDPVTLAGLSNRPGVRIAIAVAVGLALATVLMYGLLSGDDAVAATKTAAAAAPASPPPVKPALELVIPAATTNAVSEQPARASGPAAASERRKRADALASPAAGSTLDRVPRPARAAQATSPGSARVPATSTAPARANARPKVARGVRTAGLSEQDF